MSIKLEVGKKYETRDGQIEECVAVWSKEANGYQATVVDALGHPTFRSLYGRTQPHRDGDNPHDIVAEHREPREFLIICEPNGSFNTIRSVDSPLGERLKAQGFTSIKVREVVA